MSWERWPLAGRLPRAKWFLLLGCYLWLAACSSKDPVPADTRDPQVVQGETLFKQNCATCHATEPDTVIVGPSLAGIAGRAGTRVEGQDARQYIETSILNPDAFVVEGFANLMPVTFGRTLSGEQLDAIVAYLLTLQ